MTIPHDPSGGNPLEIEARADDLEAEALRLRAVAKRRRAQLDGLSAAPFRTEAPARDLTRQEYAQRANVSGATVSRWLADGMPSIPVGSTVRIDPTAADEWRRERGRKPTTPSAKLRETADVDVDADLGRVGLRVVGGRK